MVLLVAAGLLTRAVGHAMTLDPGFAIHESQAVSLRLPPGASTERSAVFHRTLRDALEAGQLPPLAFSEFTAITTAHRNIPFRQDDEGPRMSRAIIARDVSARYFSVLDIPLIAGRTLADDGQEIVVNQSAGRLFWPDRDPLGKRLVTGNGDAVQRYTVVGVTKNVPVTTLSEIPPVVYRSLQSGGLVLVRDLSPTIVERIAAVVRGIEPKVELAARPLADDIWTATRDVATASRFSWAVGLLALVLATVGSFGVFAYGVEERRRQIGVRMALGAPAPQVVWTVIGDARWPLFVGLGAGLVLSSAAAPLPLRPDPVRSDYVPHHVRHSDRGSAGGDLGSGAACHQDRPGDHAASGLTTLKGTRSVKREQVRVSHTAPSVLQHQYHAASFSALPANQLCRRFHLGQIWAAHVDAPSRGTDEVAGASRPARRASSSST